MTTRPELGLCRIRIRVHTRAKEIPWEEWLRPGRSLLYSWLHKQNPVLADTLHRSPQMAPFGYSAPMFPTAGRRPGVYAAGGDGYWEIGTTHRGMAEAWLQTLETKPLLNWGGVALTVTGWQVMHPPAAIGKGRVTWSTATPVVVRTTSRQGSRSLEPDDPSYLPALRASLRTRSRSIGLPDQPKLYLRSTGPRRQLLVSGTSTPRVGHPLTVELVADPLLLAAVWCTGVGQQTGAGCGWVAAQPAAGTQRGDVP